MIHLSNYRQISIAHKVSNNQLKELEINQPRFFLTHNNFAVKSPLLIKFRIKQKYFLIRRMSAERTENKGKHSKSANTWKFSNHLNKSFHTLLFQNKFELSTGCFFLISTIIVYLLCKFENISKENV